MRLNKTIVSASIMVALLAGTATPAFAEGPVLVKQKAPEYPRGAERRKLEGTVDLRFSVNDSGKVENVEVLGATVPGVFDAAATKALEGWKFEKGKPGEAEVTIAFAL